MKLEFFNTPEAQSIASVKLPEKPEFVSYEPDLGLFKELAKENEDYKNILIVGNGGSLNTVVAFCQPLIESLNKKVYYLNTVDPDYIFELKQNLKKSETLVIAISKSGETTSQIEALLQFADFPMLIVTGKSSTLRAIGEKLGAKIVMHPPIGGRYTSFSEVGLLPAMIAGLDGDALLAGGKKFHQQYATDNLAFKAASVFYQLEQKGIADVFMPIYSHNLFYVSYLIVQLCHESFGKAGKGQTYFAHEAPESQHHTNQRFFGGQKNIAGFFLSSQSVLHPTANKYPNTLKDVYIKKHLLSEIDGIPLEKSLEFECQGTLEDAKINSIPLAHLTISGYTAEEIGQLVAFWQLYAVYSSALRNVDPFDQPQVENSKVISFNKRLQFKGLV